MWHQLQLLIEEMDRRRSEYEKETNRQRQFRLMNRGLRPWLTVKLINWAAKLNPLAEPSKQDVPPADEGLQR